MEGGPGLATAERWLHFQAEITSQINLLKAVAAGEAMHTSADVMHDYRLGTPRNVQKARKALEVRDAIEKVDNSWAFLDPAFEIWFRWQFMGVAPELAAAA